MTKTKKEIVREISEKTGLTQVQTKIIVQMVLDGIVDAIVENGRIELRNFGVFEVKKRAARKARNPQTGEQVEVEEKYVVTFKPGKRMEMLVRELGEREKQQQGVTQQALGEISEEKTTEGPAGQVETPSIGSTSGSPETGTAPVSTISEPTGVSTTPLPNEQQSTGWPVTSQGSPLVSSDSTEVQQDDGVFGQ